ncbi:MAG: Peptidoglycan-N-acetylglucosamine deacetylase [Candidatus Dichloromethanomonas elyunquensis]|nr:MAG: Peptidoglycan-N-acetylglucosamine deacetylase [Candidatus Dichloromethanomonas elyunquensis]
MRIEELTGFFSVLLIFFILYCVMPEVVFHFLGIGSWKRQYSPGVTLTFDDGPDPVYTPKLLEILAKEKITACFFLLGEKVQKYPDLVKMIESQGHRIGSHGYRHRHAWLMSPHKTWELWDKSMEIIRNVIGKEPDIIRPPWGGMNLSLFLWSLFRKKKIVIWNAMGRDWVGNRSCSQIINRILRNTKEGTIILLHDSRGDEGAPANTLACIHELSLKIKSSLKLPLVPLTFPEWSLLRRIAFRVWEQWEHFYSKINHVQRINEENIFRISLNHYHGPDLINGNGELLASKGDLVGEIHLDNIRFQLSGSDPQSIGIRTLKLVRRSLPDLARYVSSDPENREVKVYLGITLLNRGVKGLGFNVQEYPSPMGRIIGLCQKILIRIYHPAGKQRRTESLGNKPKIVWIGKEDLIKKYTPQKIIS